MVRKNLICSFVLFLMFALNCQALETKKEVILDDTFRFSCKDIKTNKIKIKDKGDFIKIVAKCGREFCFKRTLWYICSRVC